MSNCCTEKPSTKNRPSCPGCGAISRKVELITLLHQVKFPFNQQLEDNEDYYFCPTRSCNIGYFTTMKTIPKKQLLAFSKIQAGWLCYCFDISEAQYRSAVFARSSESLKKFVIRKTQSGLCACEIRNPSGQCCLAALKTQESTSR